MSESEEWRPILLEPFTDLYEVSSLGRVWSRPSLRPNRHGTMTERAGRILKTPGGKRPYLSVTLAWDGQKRSVQVHALVAEAFIGPRPEGLVVRHKNGDSHDNRVVNLEYGTPGDNVHDEVRHQTHRNSSKMWCPRGHPLVAPNIYANKNYRNGSIARHCKACAKAQALMRSRGVWPNEVMLEQLRDRYADELMPGWRTWVPPEGPFDPWVAA